jgi:hypothetical protein
VNLLLHFPRLQIPADAVFWFDGEMIDEYIPVENGSTAEARYVVHKQRPVEQFNAWAYALAERNPNPMYWEVLDIGDEDPRAWFDAYRS